MVAHADELRNVARGEFGDVAVARALWRLARSTPQAADGRVREFNAQRTRTQPRILSAGSVFANPRGAFSGKLIEDAGLKGAWEGRAQISEQHANFIVNRGGATPADISALMDMARERVQAQFGMTLEAEIRIMGEG